MALLIKGRIEHEASLDLATGDDTIMPHMLVSNDSEAFKLVLNESELRGIKAWAMYCLGE